MKSTTVASELVRKPGDVLARIRYRRETLVVERSGRAVAMMVPAEREGGTVREALDAWLAEADRDPSFVDDLARVNAAGRPAANPWAS